MREPDHTRRVVITGLGIVSPIGNTVGDVWTSLTEGRSGIAQITHWAVSYTHLTLPTKRIV